MKRAGIGGAIIMDVLERFAPPPGDADYMGARWQALMRRALAKARELGIEINLTNGPGWCGSSGPWITPELSMQTLVCSTTLAMGGAPVLLPKRAAGSASGRVLQHARPRSILSGHRRDRLAEEGGRGFSG
jgi:hypothetical protein